MKDRQSQFPTKNWPHLRSTISKSRKRQNGRRYVFYSMKLRPIIIYHKLINQLIHYLDTEQYPSQNTDKPNQETFLHHQKIHETL